MFAKIPNYESFLKPRNSLIKYLSFPSPLFMSEFKGIEGRVNKIKRISYGD